MEMSKYYETIPKNYKGHDIDQIFEKIFDIKTGRKYKNPAITEEEKIIFEEASDIYYEELNKRQEEENKKRKEQWEKILEKDKKTAASKQIPMPAPLIHIGTPLTKC